MLWFSISQLTSFQEQQRALKGYIYILNVSSAKCKIKISILLILVSGIYADYTFPSHENRLVKSAGSGNDMWKILFTEECTFPEMYKLEGEKQHETIIFTMPMVIVKESQCKRFEYIVKQKIYEKKKKKVSVPNRVVGKII